MEKAHTFGINNIGKKPIGQDSLCVSTPLLHSIINFSICSGLFGFTKLLLLKPPRPPSANCNAVHITTNIIILYQLFVLKIILNIDIISIAMPITVKYNFITHHGVEPTAKNIANGKYPLTTTLYAITLEDNKKSTISLFLEWMQSEQGKTIVEKTGYVISDKQQLKL